MPTESKRVNILSIVVPCHNEQESIDAFIEEVESIATGALSKLNIQVEYIFVDDGSKDKTLAILRAKAQQNNRISYLSFSRNFGKEAALFAGLENISSDSDLVAVMDCDLQDPPRLLPQMCEQVLSGQSDRVAAYRVSRDGEPPIRSWFAHKFYQLMNLVSEVELRDGARDFSVMNRQFLQAVLSCREYNRFTKGLFGWVGFKTSWVSYENVERVAGETNWSFSSLVKYAIDGIIAYTVKPLQWFMWLGIALSLAALFFMIVIIIRAMLFGDPVAGWPSLMSTLLLLSGIIIQGIGILGLYLSKIYTEIKARPIYLIAEKHLHNDK